MLSEHPSETVPQATQGVSGSQGIYRFWSNKRITVSQILSSHRPSVIKRVNQQPVVLAVQDTTDLDLSGLKQTSIDLKGQNSPAEASL